MERLFSSPIVGINKNKAGRLLDGRTWNNMPALAVVGHDILYEDLCYDAQQAAASFLF